MSQEQQRRRTTPSSLPHEHDDREIVRHQLLDPQTQEDIPGRVVFVFSTADQKVGRQTRDQAIAQIQAGLEQVAATVPRGQPGTTPASSARRVTKLLGNKGAAQYFRWELLTRTSQEQGHGRRLRLPPADSPVRVPLRCSRCPGRCGRRWRRGPADHGTA